MDIVGINSIRINKLPNIDFNIANLLATYSLWPVHLEVDTGKQEDILFPKQVLF
mgnify:CR=1 FL=1